MMTRREINVGILASAAFAAAPGDAGAQAPSALKLPPPRKTGGLPLFDAIARRHSTREYSDRPLPPQALSDLLWAAFGVNRPDGGRTAPYARHIVMIDVYVATADGVWLYEPMAHVLLPHMTNDIRAATGEQDFVGRAALDLVYVAHGERMSDVSPEERRLNACVDAGFIGQNVYLFCASEGLRDGLSRRARRGRARSDHEVAERAVRDLRADGRIRRLSRSMGAQDEENRPRRAFHPARVVDLCAVRGVEPKFAGVRAISGTVARFRRNAARSDGPGRHRSGRAFGDDARRAGGARYGCRDQARPHRERLPRARNHQASHALRRLRPSAAAGRESGGRRTLALRRTARIQRRHGQRPHQRPLSRRKELRSVLGARRSARRPHLSASPRPLRRASHAQRPSRALGRDLGLDGGDGDACACAWCSAACSIDIPRRG